MKWIVMVIFALSLLPGTAAIQADDAKGEKSLQGNWTLISGEADGKAIPEKELKGAKLEIKGNAYTVTIPGKGVVKGTQKTDATKEPRTIDIVDADGANQGKTCLGIYEVKGDEFRVTFNQPGKPRPTKFATAPDSGQWVHVWKRVK